MFLVLATGAGVGGQNFGVADAALEASHSDWLCVLALRLGLSEHELKSENTNGKQGPAYWISYACLS